MILSWYALTIIVLASYLSTWKQSTLLVPWMGKEMPLSDKARHHKELMHTGFSRRFGKSAVQSIIVACTLPQHAGMLVRDGRPCVSGRVILHSSSRRGQREGGIHSFIIFLGLLIYAHCMRSRAGLPRHGRCALLKEEFNAPVEVPGMRVQDVLCGGHIGACDALEGFNQVPLSYVVHLA
jgi:hypothetical protein